MTTEPQTSTAALVVAIVSPFFGQFAIIIFAALAGALWPLSVATTPTRADGAFLLLRLVTTAVALTGFIAWALEQKTGFPASKALAPVSFLIAAFGDNWRDILASAVARVRSVIGGGQ